MRLTAAIFAAILLAAPAHAERKAPKAGDKKEGAKPEKRGEAQGSKEVKDGKAPKGAAAAGKDAPGGEAFGAREALAKLQAMDIFPEMEDGESEFAKAVAAEVKRLEQEEPEFFKSPAWPLRAARRVAADLGAMPRTVAQIREHVAKTFDLDDDAFQQVHGIQITSAQITLGGEPLDVTPQLASRVTARGLEVDCGWSLATALADEAQFERNADESKADYWKRQRRLLGAAASPVRGTMSLLIAFEFHSEQLTASAKEGERIVISEEGEVTVSKIAPAARPVRGPAAEVSGKKERPPAKPAPTKR